MLAIVTEYYATHCSLMRAEHANRRASPSIPNLHVSIQTPRDQVSTVGAECHTEEFGVARPCARQREYLASRMCVPNLYGKKPVVGACGGNSAAIRLPGYAKDNIPLFAELGADKASLQAPHFGGSAEASRNNLLAVGADRQS